MESKFLLEDSMRILSRMFLKIVKANLTTGRFHVVKLPEEEVMMMRNCGNNLYKWMENFEKAGYIYEKDIDEFRKMCKPKHMREHFRNSDECLRCRYRRLTDNKFRWVVLEVLPAEGYNHKNQIVMIYIHDVHDSYSRELDYHREIEYRCNIDALTGLKNFYAYETFKQEYAQENNPASIGIVFSDLNGLKMINDTKGHDAGNEYLIRFSNMLKTAFPKNDIYRISGDEFIVICENEDRFLQLAGNFYSEVQKDEVPMAAVGYSVNMCCDDIADVAEEAEGLMYLDKQLFYTEHPSYRRSAVEKRFKNEMEAMFQALSTGYTMIAWVYLEEDRFNVVKHGEIDLPDSGGYSYLTKAYGIKLVDEHYLDIWLETSTIKNLTKSLTDEELISCDLRLRDGRWVRVNFKAVEKENSLPVKILVYTEIIDKARAFRLDARQQAMENAIEK